MIDYRDFVPRQNGFVFKFIKKDNQFIHTYIEGDLLQKLGLTPSMVIGRTVFDFFPQDHARQKERFYVKAWNGETVNYEGSVGDTYYRCSLFPITINSQVVEVNGSAIDITVEKNNEKRIREMEKLSVVGELAAGIAHEIRNPLTSLIGFTKIIKEKITDSSINEYLVIMEDELDRINQIVNEFMFIAKPNETMEIKEANINALVRNVIKFMEPQTNLKSILVNLYFSDKITAFCDPNQIKQVLINIIQNAIEATSESLSIDISLKKLDENQFKIEIRDRGCGISEERLKRLFEPFYTTKEKGTGLGLMVCKRIIEIHNGTIEVKSNPGFGTIFEIVLPIKQKTSKHMIKHQS
ncbi:ATP-binding protein [Peribacillus saganii]|nr:ATP-binding protein [Peribacillus saganii]